jgi:carboxylesterase
MTKSGHAVLLLHGLGGGASEMLYLRRELKKKGFVVEVPILPGHGTHYSDLRKYKWEDYANAAYAEFEKLYEKYETVSVSGLCMGAVLALCIAIRYGDKVNAICPISTTLNFDGWGLPYITRYISLLRFTPLYFFYNVKESEPYGVKDPEIRKWIKRKMSATSTTHYSKIPASSAWEMRKMNDYVKQNLDKIAAPVYVIHALEDEVTSPQSIVNIRMGITGAPFDCLILYDSYHLATIDRQKDFVAQKAGEFFIKHACNSSPISTASSSSSVSDKPKPQLKLVAQS